MTRRWAPLAALVAACSGQTDSTPAADDGGADATIDATIGTDAGADAKPDTAGSGPRVAALAMKKIYVGDADRNGVASATAWKSFGDNIDGLVTTAQSTDTCQLAPGAPKSAQVDGDNGIDNAFGHTILPIMMTFDASYGTKVNQALAVSTFNVLTRIDPPAALYGGAPTLSPAFDGTDIWPVTYESVQQGDVTKPKVLFPAASKTGQAWTSGDASGQGMLSLPLFAGANLPVRVNRLHVRMTLDLSGSGASNGVLSGVIPTDDLVKAVQIIAPSISSSLCSGAALDSIVAQLRQASDILADGTQDPSKPCDGISFGFGFDAATVKIGDVAAAQNPPVNTCE